MDKSQVIFTKLSSLPQDYQKSWMMNSLKGLSGVYNQAYKKKNKLNNFAQNC